MIENIEHTIVSLILADKDIRKHYCQNADKALVMKSLVDELGEFDARSKCNNSNL